MRQVLYLCIAVLCVGCTNVHRVNTMSAGSASTKDAAVRAYLGVKALRREYAAGAVDFWYAVTYAKFEDGRFLGFGDLDTGSTTRSPALFELAWGKQEDRWTYVLITPFSTSMGSDPFLEHLSSTSEGKSSVPLTLEALEDEEKFKDWYVLAIASGGSKLDERRDLEPLGSGYRFQRYTLLFLIRPCPKGMDYIKLLEEFGKL